jgi:acyl dehydratase
MYGRFSKPVLPGESLTVSIWLTGDNGTAESQAAVFQTAKADGTVVIDRGRFVAAAQ